jgi:hypothetical protein
MTSSPLTQFLAVFEHPVVFVIAGIVVLLLVVLSVARLARR